MPFFNQILTASSSEKDHEIQPGDGKVKTPISVFTLRIANKKPVGSQDIRSALGETE